MLQHPTTRVHPHPRDDRNEVYYSNRSAAHASLGDWAAAKLDALRVTQLKPGWAKGHARLGAAYLGLQVLMCVFGGGLKLV